MTEKSTTRLLCGMVAAGCCLILATPVRVEASPTEERSLNKCQQVVNRASARLVNKRARTLANCLQRASKEVVAKTGADATRAAKRCSRRFLRIQNSAKPTKTLSAKFEATVTKDCDPASDRNVTHHVADIIGTGADVVESIQAENLGVYCAAFGGDGAVDDLDEWIACLLAVGRCQADLAMSVQYPRTIEWLAEMRPQIEALDADALAVLDALDLSLDANRDDTIDIRCGPDGPQFFPATGQKITYPADKNGAPASAVQDDGAVQAGAAFSYFDNGDGTITDFNTGLMWEKKGDNGGLHDEDLFFPWSNAAADTIWDWLDQVNAEGGTGLAGYDDWRIPNVKELMSLIDYNRTAPAVDPAFETDCIEGCTVTECSCVAPASYWSSTSLRSFPSHSWHVSFEFGYVEEIDRTTEYFVRAVRTFED